MPFGMAKKKSRNERNKRFYFIFISQTLFCYVDLSFWPIAFSFSLKNIFQQFAIEQVCWRQIPSVSGFLLKSLFISPLVWRGWFAGARIPACWFSLSAINISLLSPFAPTVTFSAFLTLSIVGFNEQKCFPIPHFVFKYILKENWETSMESVGKRKPCA